MREIAHKVTRGYACIDQFKRCPDCSDTCKTQDCRSDCFHHLLVLLRPLCGMFLCPFRLPAIRAVGCDLLRPFLFIHEGKNGGDERCNAAGNHVHRVEKIPDKNAACKLCVKQFKKDPYGNHAQEIKCCHQNRPFHTHILHPLCGLRFLHSFRRFCLPVPFDTFSADVWQCFRSPEACFFADFLKLPGGLALCFFFFYHHPISPRRSCRA